MHAVALAARQLADLLLLVRPLEVEQPDIGPACHLAAAEVDLVLAVGDLLEHRLVGAQAVAALVDIAELDGLADPERALVGLLLAGDHAEQRRLAGAVRADPADDAARRQARKSARLNSSHQCASRLPFFA